MFFVSFSVSQDINEIVLKEGVNVVTGAEQINVYLPWIKNKNIAIVTNHTGIVKNVHLVDTLLSCGVKIKKIFTPEHGFRGDVEAGKSVLNTIDKKTGLPVISLYGEKKKPTKEDLKGIDIVLFDIQDIGVRFYTYISTLSLVMEACAENNVSVIILDRPNPNGHYIDGPVLETKLTSFVGLHPIPIVYGMTIAEYALMVNGEGWLKNHLRCNLKYVPLLNYDHKTLYTLPISPSPNIPNMAAVYLYPTLGLFEGTVISVARGTDFPFQAFGHPDMKNASFSFTPRIIPGVCSSPPYLNIECKGYDLRSFGENYFCNHRQIYLYWLIQSYHELGSINSFFNDYFDKLAGTYSLKKQIIEGKNEEEIRASWTPAIENFKIIRKKYLLYPDFE